MKLSNNVYLQYHKYKEDYKCTLYQIAEAKYQWFNILYITQRNDTELEIFRNEPSIKQLYRDLNDLQNKIYEIKQQIRKEKEKNKVWKKRN